MKAYMLAVSPMWSQVVHVLAEALDNVVAEAGLRKNAGQALEQFAQKRFLQAMNLLAQHMPAAAGPNAQIGAGWIVVP